MDIPRLRIEPLLFAVVHDEIRQDKKYKTRRRRHDGNANHEGYQVVGSINPEVLEQRLIEWLPGEKIVSEADFEEEEVEGEADFKEEKIDKEADSIETAVKDILKKGYRTGDLKNEETPSDMIVGCSKMGDIIAAEIK